MGIFDLPGFEDFIGGLDGKVISGDCFGTYDEDHKRKVKELVAKDSRFLSLIKKRCGMDPYDDSYYGPDTDIRIINLDHFAIKGKLKDKLEEYRQKVYAAIDEIYAEQDDTDLGIEIEEEEDEGWY